MDFEPEVPVNRFEKSLVLMGKTVDFIGFAVEAPAFYAE